MHYANGREAKVGDLVKGKGYNFKHEIIGILVETAPNNGPCNCTIACVGFMPGSALLGSVPVRFVDGKAIPIESVPLIEAVNEYGQLDAFVALDPETGDVLLPEAA